MSSVTFDWHAEVEVEYDVIPNRPATLEQPAECGVEITAVNLITWPDRNTRKVVDVKEFVDDDTLSEWANDIYEDLEDS